MQLSRPLPLLVVLFCSVQFQKFWQKKYCQLFKASNHGIERLEVFENKDDSLKNSVVKIITLENCIKITQDAQKSNPFVFSVSTNSLWFIIMI